VIGGNSNGEILAALEQMSDHEIYLSLPKPIGMAKEEDRRTPILDAQGDIVVAGDVAGIVVFPPNIQDRMLRAWLQRRAATASGQLSKTVDAITHARPATSLVEDLQQKARPLPGAMRRALPRPKKRPNDADEEE
jgi:hypothetical protein